MREPENQFATDRFHATEVVPMLQTPATRTHMGKSEVSKDANIVEKKTRLFGLLRLVARPYQ